MSQTFEDKALYRIRETEGGWAFSPRDFLDLGGRPTVDSGLHQLEKRGEIRRAIRGIYDYPGFSNGAAQIYVETFEPSAKARWRLSSAWAYWLDSSILICGNRASCTENSVEDRNG
jgi:hypothetical protein